MIRFYEKVQTVEILWSLLVCLCTWKQFVSASDNNPLVEKKKSTCVRRKIQNDIEYLSILWCSNKPMAVVQSWIDYIFLLFWSSNIFQADELQVKNHLLRIYFNMFLWYKLPPLWSSNISPTDGLAASEARRQLTQRYLYHVVLPKASQPRLIRIGVNISQHPLIEILTMF